MAITSSEFDYDMSSWVAEKADCVLEEVCRIVDILNENNITLPELDEMIFSQAIRSIIFDAAKLSSFGHENMQSWDNDWVDLMYNQGRDRYLEFRKRAMGEVPNDTPPEKWPLSVQKTLNLFDEVEGVLNLEDKSEIRNQVLQCGRELTNSRFDSANQIGDKLLQLVDDQAVDASLDWASFIRNVNTLIKNERVSFIQEVEKPVGFFK